jgi:predicted DNA-binding WGR domain protein
MKRYFEFQDSKSYKFWQIEIDGTNFTVTYGKIGTAGLAKVTECASIEAAEKEANKLISEKTKKGYVEKLEASSKKISKRLSLTYDEAEDGKTILEKMEAFVNGPQAAETEALVIGAWEEAYETCPTEALDLLFASANKLSNLREIFIGDMDSEECEVSWIQQDNYTKLFTAFPLLERLHIKGSTGLILSEAPISHANLKALTIECGGLPKKIIQQIATANLPNLEYLQLYLGVEDYGFDADIIDLHPFILTPSFPKLKHLGLMDSEIADEIATVIANAPILQQLESLDLSQGTLSDEGAQHLLASDAIKQLKKLDLHYHYLSNDMMKKLKALPLIVDVSDQQDTEDDWRYPAVTE